MLPSQRDVTPLLSPAPRGRVAGPLGDLCPVRMALGCTWPGGRCIDVTGAGAPLRLHASSPRRVTLAERKEWMMKTMVLGQEWRSNCCKEEAERHLQ